MQFTSLLFFIFLGTVFGLYWFVFQKKLTFQNLLIVIASYTFYAVWDWRFLFLIIFSTAVDFLIARSIAQTESKTNRKTLLGISIGVNLGFLGFFKYFNFFLDNFMELLQWMGFQAHVSTLQIILPVGISFYTFQTLSYTIDVYRGKLEPSKDFIAFAAFVGFFPQLVAGPIERAVNLLPQFYKFRAFDYGSAVLGARQALWGFFKKVVIADNCAPLVDQIFSGSETLEGSTLLLGAFLFACQIYGDFSGYSDIAIGISRFFGINLMQNFAFPYFSRDIAEFWRRWHISLSTWFRDYVYIPLGGSQGGNSMKIRNTVIIFVVSGFWHGANWTFIFWGLLNALYFVPLMLFGKNRANMDIVAKGKLFPSVQETGMMMITFFLTLLAWILFRAENMTHAWGIYAGIFSESLWILPSILPRQELVLITFFFAMEWLGRSNQFAIEGFFSNQPKVVRWSFYGVLVWACFFFAGQESEFIYFQF
ncbi:MBOAT family O-acyltransferase [Mongoliitalea daihaiensis]|uniref:MBOAT family O-acyltransferase n=1 Tax=Mongoliitalea daihaiensis TaxID=2782006 RepID=UPI001F3AFE8E|nr:MBOAT family O-acyltransferase [Mongoliitalea daihaiensis]UJP64903.1 MBOAT family protein [Mongoliitalea daihaiensis]